MLNPQLEDLILAAFMRAEAEGRRDAAEHLMRALEALGPCPEDAGPGGLALAKAYGHLVREGPSAAGSGVDGPGGRRTTRTGGEGPGTTRASIRSRGRRQ